jgi:hypothetical protein
VFRIRFKHMLFKDDHFAKQYREVTSLWMYGDKKFMFYQDCASMCVVVYLEVEY